ncbi:MAG: DUF1573 domain-containing protein [Schleiferiaceae bacterium]|jgi:hypothetical protein|nr:DUF1573 domain-containing protein [Schleiferiaceae bacterium]MDP5015679.1 DUF1573 domain-containing protein [Schleiferiaceae bacterium]HAG34640.1 hypothetical protein [Cryomorphaceae bacterium]
MKHFFTAAAVILASSFAFAQEANTNAAQISFTQETIDYGNIKKDANGEREFVFKNTGKEPLIITNCVGSCGCTVPVWPKTPIAPGEKASIKVKYDTRRVGRFQKTVTVTSNAGTPTKVLTIKGNVEDVPATATTPVNNAPAASKVSK